MASYIISANTAQAITRRTDNRTQLQKISDEIKRKAKSNNNNTSFYISSENKEILIQKGYKLTTHQTLNSTIISW